MERQAQQALRVLPDSTEQPGQQAWLVCPVPRVRLALTAQLEPQVPPG